MTEAAGLAPLLDRSRCIVCVGPGGVGKTSTSAAIAVQAARQGRRTVVLTIDPARRLANALGLPEIGSVEHEIPKEAFETVGLPVPSGRMTAMMLDIKQAWDEVILRYHPDEERKNRLLSNRLYEAMSTALAGSQEYMAMEKLYALSTRTEDVPDVIVLDTPPANHALDFLEAPSRMFEALDNDATRWLLEPYERKRGLAGRIFDASSSVFIRTISRFVGNELLEDLAELLSCFQGMFTGFRERAGAVKTILSAEDTAFLVVSTPVEQGLQDAHDFQARLRERDVQVGGVVLNRALPPVFAPGEHPAPDAVAAAVAAAGGDTGFADAWVSITETAARQAAAQAADIEAFRGQVKGPPVVVIPELAKDVHDLLGLQWMQTAMFPELPKS